MRIMSVVGKVTLSRCHPALSNASWKLAVPLTKDDLVRKQVGSEEPIVVFDEFQAGTDSLMAVSESAEASAAFYPETKPIDAYNAAILDSIDVW